MKKWKKHHVVCAYILAAVLCLTVVCLLLVKLKCSGDTSQNEAATELFAMDTYITMTAYGRNAETAKLRSFALQMAEETNGALEPTIYPVLTAWGFTTEENRVPSDAEIVELLENVGYERVRLEGNTVRLDNGMMLDSYAGGRMPGQDLRSHGLVRFQSYSNCLPAQSSVH